MPFIIQMELVVSRIVALELSSLQADTVLTPSQKRFNTLIRQIDQARKKVAVWQESVAAYRQAHSEVLKPLQAELLVGLRQWVVALDAVLCQGRWSHAEQDTLRELLCEAASELLGARGDDVEIKALFDKHSDVDFDTDKRHRMQAMKGMAEAMTGLDLGAGEDIESEADLFERLQKGLEAHGQAEDAQLGAKASLRRKSAAQQRRETEAVQATQSVREVYRKLASALHPDRETDEQQRAAKTLLMQRVNQAYEANDLLSLLELQLQIEQIDASQMANAGEQRLKHYNKVLGDQLAGLKAELEEAEMAFCMEFGLEPGWGLNPHKLGQVLEQTSRQWQAERSEQQHELRMLGDFATTKRWLKRQRQRRRDDEFDSLPF
jgi:hypothetical protein